MSWLLLVLGLLLCSCCVAMAMQLAFSPRYRRMMKATGQPPWLILLLVLPAVVFTAAAFSPEKLGWAPVASIAPILGVGLWTRRKHQGRTDLPPVLKRLEGLPLNPLVTLRHPIRSGRAHWEILGHPIRDRRETRAWLDERDRNRQA